MATETIAGALGEVRAASTAGGGTALTTTAQFIQLPGGTNFVRLMGRNYSTAVVIKFLFNPWLVVLKTTDNMMGQPTDYSSAAQDGDATTDVDVGALDTLANGDFLLIGAHIPFRGVSIDVDAANTLGTATTTVTYWDGTTWTTTSATDNTNSTMTFAVDGTVTWTVPTAWQAARLIDLYPHHPIAYYSSPSLYWTRWAVSATLADTTITFNSMLAMNRSTAYAELTSGDAWPQRISHGRIGGIGAIESLTDAGTANLVVNAATLRDGEFA